MNKKLIFISISLVGILILPTLSLGQTQNTTFSQIDCSQYTSQQEKLMCTYFNLLLQLYTLLIQQLQSRIGIQPGQPVQPTEPSQPVITSISPNPATIGQTITVTGRNLKGFEGDKILIIENSAGEKGIIRDESGSVQDGIIKFNLKDTYCTINTSYSGLPCPSYINITQGTYYVYTQPWGKISNKLEFRVIPPSNQPPITVLSPSIKRARTSSIIGLDRPLVTDFSPDRLITVLSPNGGEKWEIGKTYKIIWQQPKDAPVSIVIDNDLLPPLPNSDSFSYLKSISRKFNGKTGTNEYSWTIPNDIPSSLEYIICIGYYRDSQIVERQPYCSAPFSIVSTSTPNPPLLKLISPADSEVLVPGSSYTIRWNATPDLIHKYPNVDIILEGIFIGGGGRCHPSGCGVLPQKNVFARIWDDIISLLQGQKVQAQTYKNDKFVIASNISLEKGSYVWDIPSNITSIVHSSIGWYRLRFVRAKSNEGIYPYLGSGFRFAQFVPQTPSITVLSPNGGEVWNYGRTNFIRWKFSGKFPNGFNIYLSECTLFPCVSSRIVTGFMPGAEGMGNSILEYSWDTKTLIGSEGLTKIVNTGQYKITVEGNDTRGVADQSDAPFRINIEPPSYSFDPNKKMLVFSIDQGWKNGIIQLQDTVALERIISTLKQFQTKYNVYALLTIKNRDKAKIENVLNILANNDIPFIFDVYGSDVITMGSDSVNNPIDVSHGRALSISQLKDYKSKYGNMLAGLRAHEVFAENFTILACQKLGVDWCNDFKGQLPSNNFYQKTFAEDYIKFAKENGMFLLWSDFYWSIYHPWDFDKNVVKQPQNEQELKDLLTLYPNTVIVTFANNEPLQSSRNKINNWKESVQSFVNYGAKGFGLSNQSWMCESELSPEGAKFYGVPENKLCPISEISQWTINAFRDGALVVQFEPVWYFWQLPKGDFREGAPDYTIDPNWKNIRGIPSQNLINLGKSLGIDVKMPTEVNKSSMLNSLNQMANILNSLNSVLNYFR